jgi:pimeloyl-ACP methyl ester carboxylesterase
MQSHTTGSGGAAADAAVPAEKTGDRVLDWPLEAGLETRWVSAHDGTRLRVLVGGAKHGPRVVFVHGFPQNAAEWRKVAARLADRFRVVLYDLRGFGASELGQSGSYDLDTLASDLDAVIDATADEGDASLPPIVCAHDWGGPIAWHALGRRPSLARGHVSANGPHASAYTRDLVHTPEQRARAWYTVVFQIPGIERLLSANGAASIAWMLRRSSPAGLFTDEELELYLAPMRDPARLRAGLSYYRAAARRLIGGRAQAFEAPVVTVPTIIVWGERDAALVRSAPDTIQTHYCPAAEVRRLPASHWVPEECPDDVARAIEDLDARTRP